MPAIFSMAVLCIAGLVYGPKPVPAIILGVLLFLAEVALLDAYYSEALF
jgi:hypothetical protein